MCFLCHSEYFAHLRRRWSGTVDASDTALLLHSILLPELLKVGVLECLSCRHPMVMVIYQKFLDDLSRFRVLWNHLLKTSSLLLWEIELHVRSHFLELVQKLFLGCAQNVMNFVNLVELIRSWE